MPTSTLLPILAVSQRYGWHEANPKCKVIRTTAMYGCDCDDCNLAEIPLKHLRLTDFNPN